MKKYIYYTLVVIFLINSKAYSQLGIGTTSPNGSSVLHLYSTNKGFLPPRMNTTLRNSISNPAHGLLIYNLSNASVEYYDSINSSWKSIITSVTAGWYTVGNSGTSSYTNFVGTTDNRSLVFRTNNIERVRIDSNGRIGIGTSSPNSTLQLIGSLTLPVTTQSGTAYTPTASDYTILCTTSGTITINLPTAASVTGRIYVIKKLSLTSSGNVIIDPAGTELIDGASTDASLNAQYESMIIQSDGSNWYILARQ